MAVLRPVDGAVVASGGLAVGLLFLSLTLRVMTHEIWYRWICSWRVNCGWIDYDTNKS